MVNYYRHLEAATTAAYQAGAILMSTFNQLRSGETQYVHRLKEGNIKNVSIPADLDSEGAIIKVLEERFPDVPILAEETKSTINLSGVERLWAVDPLDGTRLFRNGIEQFSISIAYWENGETKAGVVYAPASCEGEMYSAVRGEGVRLNGDPLVKINPGDALKDSIAATGFNYVTDERKLERSMKGVFNVLGKCSDIARFGSGAYDLCRVAAGRVGAYFERDGPKPWDVAAALLIAEESGCPISIYDGSPIDIFHRKGDNFSVQFLVSKNRQIHDELVTLLRDYGK